MLRTTATIQENLQELAQYNRDQLELKSVRELRSYMSILGVNTIMRDGKPVPMASGRKHEYITALLGLTEPTRVIQQLPDLTEEAVADLLVDDDAASVDIEDIGVRYFTKVYEYTQRQFDISAQKYKLPDATLGALAADLAIQLQRRRTRTGLPLSTHTILNYRTMISNRMVRCSWQFTQDAHAEQLKQNILSFREALRLATASLQQEKRDKGDANLSERRQDMTIVNLDRLLEKATEAIRTRDNWMDVSIAIALLTGRRMAEVQATAEFAVVDEYTLDFRGQTKVKGKTADYYEQNDSYTIPTLAPAQEIAEALQWLTEQKRRIRVKDSSGAWVMGYEKRKTASTPASIVFTPEQTIAAKAANDRYAKDLNKRVKERWFSEVTVVGGKAIDPGDISYHTMRQFYAIVVIARFCPAEVNEVTYCGILLGHGKSDDAKEDLSTPQRYLSDFKLQ